MATIYRLKDDAAYNPLADGKTRNLPCVCGSGVKRKKCCGSTRYIPKEMADELKGLQAREVLETMKEIHDSKE